MKKTKTLFIFLIVCFVIALSSTGCFNKNDLIKLLSPIVTINGDTAVWSADSNAEKYEISIDGTLFYVENSVTQKVLMPGQHFKVRAIGDDIKYSTSDWSNEVVCNKVVEDTFTVTWKNGDIIIEIDKNVEYGIMPKYDGEIPKQAPDNENKYTFSGWDPQPSAVVSDITYTAQFSASKRKYTVTFYDDDGVNVLGTAFAYYGEAVSFPKASPEKIINGERNILYKWVTTQGGVEVADLSRITCDTNVYASYISANMEFTVNFRDYNGEILKSEKVKIHDSALPPENPIRDGYRFDCWSKSYDDIIEDTDIVAQYVRQFIVRFLDWDDSVIKTVFVDYGENAQAPDDPERAQYRFIGWNGVYTNVDRDTNVKAEYIRQYTVTFINYDGTIIFEESVDEGADASLPNQPEREGYTFIGWEGNYTQIKADTEVYATYEINVYTVQFKMPDGEIIEMQEEKSNGEIISVKEKKVAHGGSIQAPEVDEMYFDWNKMKGYYFTGWSDELKNITHDMVITAKYETEIEQPILAIESVEVIRGKSSAEVRVYLCYSGKIYGINLGISYDQKLDIKNIADVEANRSFVYDENGKPSNAKLNVDKHEYELSWADGNGNGVEVEEYVNILTIDFNLDTKAPIGNYIINALQNTYIIVENLKEITPIIVVGEITIK